jgi:hypothetical protein
MEMVAGAAEKNTEEIFCGIRELWDVVIFWATKMVGPTYGLGPFVNGEGALSETALSPVLCAS